MALSFRLTGVRSQMIKQERVIWTKTEVKMNPIKGEKADVYTLLVYGEAHTQTEETTNKLMPVSIQLPPWFPEGCTNTFAIMGFCEIASLFSYLFQMPCSVMSDSLRPLGL